MTRAGEDERPLGTLCPDGTLRVPGVDLPGQDQVLTGLLGCTLATRFQRDASPYVFTAHERTGLVTLEGPGPVAEIAVRRGDAATVNTFHPSLFGLVPALPEVVAYAGERLTLASGFRLHVSPALACHHRHAAFISREALDRTGHDHPFRFGVRYDPAAAPAAHVLTLALALMLESGEQPPHAKAPYV